MKVTLKYTLVAAGAVALLAGASAGLALVYRNEILKALLASFAQSKHATFDAKEVNFMLSANLRNTKFLFKDVSIDSKNDTVSKADFSAQVGLVGVEVDVLSFLLHKELKIKKISVADGSLRLPPAAKGGEGRKSEELEALLQNIKMLSVENFTVYAAQGRSKTVRVALQSVTVQASSGSKGLAVKVKGHLQLSALNAKGQPVQAQTHLSVDARGTLAQGVLTLGDSRATVNALRLTASGELALQPLGQCNLTLRAKNIDVEKTLPDVRRYADLGALEGASGSLSATVNLHGSLAGGAQLQLRAEGSYRQGELRLKEQPTVGIQHLNYRLKSDEVSSLKSYSCEVEKASVSYRGFALSGEASTGYLSAPTYEARLTFSGDVKTLNVESLTGGKIMGSAEVRARELSAAGVEKLDVLMDVSQLNARLLNETYVIDGEIFANKNSASPRVSIRSGIVSGSFEGKLQGYLPYLLDSQKPCEVSVTGTLAADALDLDKLFLVEDDEQSALTLRAEVNARAKEMRLFNERCLNSSAKVSYTTSSIAVNQLKTEMYGGSIAGDLKILTPENRSKRLNLDLYFREVEIHKLTFLNKNFNIKSNSIQGLCNGAISLSSTLDGEGLNLQNAKGTANFTIQNGRLYEFEPLQALSGYLKKKLLQDVSFSALHNTVSIENGAVTIPRMEVRSSALNTYISGKQQLNGDFDYHLTLFVSELLLQKSRNIENPIRDDKTKLFLRFTGKDGKHEVSLDPQERSSSRARERREAAAREEKISLEWEGQAIEKKQPAPSPKEEKKQPAERKKSEVAIEWEE